VGEGETTFIGVNVIMEARCHCKNISIRIDHRPSQLTSCNCSFCYRIGALWGYFEPHEVDVYVEDKTAAGAYCHGDMYIRFHHCSSCGCTTHYTMTDKSQKQKVAVNFRMVEPALCDDIEVKLFDGANRSGFVR